MEEDIEILKGVNAGVLYFAKDKEYERYAQAIENIIQAYKDQKCKADIQDVTIKNMQDFMEQLEKELEPIRELNIPVKTVVAELNRLEDLEDDREQLKLTIKELEKENEFWKEYKEKLDKLDTKDFIFKHELENYIPKSVIREKIEELEGMIPNQYVHIDYTKKMLKELLGDEQ